MAVSLLDKISSRVSELTKSERKIAAAVLADPALTAGENIAQLAKRAKVSEPTVYRFCKTFGTDGFPAFKAALSAELSAERYVPRERVKLGDSVEDVASKVIGSSIAALNDLSRSLDCSVLARCIDLISQARRVAVAADGLSQPAGLMFQVSMLRLGLSCELITDSTMLSLVSAALRPAELLVVISSTGRSRAMVQAALSAQKGGASVIAVCPRESDLSKCEGLNLCCPPAEGSGEELWSSRLALMNLLQVVLSGVRLRRADSVRDLKPRLDAAQSRSYLPAAAEQTEQREAPAADPSGGKISSELKAGEPIAALTWPY